MHSKVQEFLERRQARYETVAHPGAVSAQEQAAVSHTPGRQFAKVVVVKERDGYVLAVVPATCAVDLDRLKGLIGHGEVRLATVEEIARAVPDCVPGAIPPFGGLWRLRTFADRRIVGGRDVTMPAGDLATAIRMRVPEYRRLVAPREGDFAVPGPPAATRQRRRTPSPGQTGRQRTANTGTQEARGAMRHPKRTITRTIRTRRPVHPGRDADELAATTWPENIRVGDRMTRSVVTVHSDALVQGAAGLMRSRKIRHLPVVDREGRLMGILTDRDLRQMVFDPAMQARLADAPKILSDLAVRDVMTWGVLTVRPETDIRQAARLMHEQKIGALPVIRGDRVVGILTESDVLKAFTDVLGEAVLARPYRWAFAPR